MLIIDVSPIVFRAFHGNKELHGANLVVMIDNVLQGMKPTHAVACLDLPGTTWRHQLFDGYKAKRPEKDEDLVKLLGIAPELFDALGIRTYSMEGYEADDVVASFAAQHGGIVYSSDKDFYQLLDVARIYDPIKDRYVTWDDCEKKFGTRHPWQIPHVQGLTGDTSDGYPGAKSVGLKKATKYLAKHSTVFGLYAAVKGGDTAGMTKRAITALLRDERDVRLAYRLAVLDRRLDVPPMDDFTVRPANVSRMDELKEALGL